MYHARSQSALTVVTTLQNSPWLSVSAVGPLLVQLASTNMTSPTSKFDSYTAITLALGTAPYVISDGSPSRPVDIRFSAVGTNPPLLTAFYICRDFATWHEIFDDLVQALVTLPNPDPDLDTSIPLFYEAFQAFVDTLNNGYGVFNYQKFESFYSLTWS
jgi:hypothetical protein